MGLTFSGRAEFIQRFRHTRQEWRSLTANQQMSLSVKIAAGTLGIFGAGLILGGTLFSQGDSSSGRAKLSEYTMIDRDQNYRSADLAADFGANSTIYTNHVSGNTAFAAESTTAGVIGASEVHTQLATIIEALADRGTGLDVAAAQLAKLAPIGAITSRLRTALEHLTSDLRAESSAQRSGISTSLAKDQLTNAAEFAPRQQETKATQLLDAPNGTLSVATSVMQATGLANGALWNADRAQRLLLPKGTEDLNFVGEARLAECGPSPTRKGKDCASTNPEFARRSTEIALADGRAMVMCPHAMIHAGHGNGYFAASGIVALAARYGYMPVVPCKFSKLHTSPFRNFHCVSNVTFGGMGDGGFIPNVKYQEMAKKNAEAGKHISISGYFQHYPAIGDQTPAVCWSLRPDSVKRQQAFSYYQDQIIGGELNISRYFDSHTSLVAVHVRRGDYITTSSQELHGALTRDYYVDAWQLVLSRAKLADPLIKLVVVIFSQKSSKRWCEENLADAFPGAAAVKFVDPFPAGTAEHGGMDLIALSLADYFILANSTFSWWAHFLAGCRAMFTGWWTLSGEEGKEWGHPRRSPREKIAVLPRRWHKVRDAGGWPETYNYMAMDYLVPNTKRLFEGNVTHERGAVKQPRRKKK